MTDTALTCVAVTPDMWAQMADAFGWIALGGLLVTLTLFFGLILPVLRSVVWPVFDAWNERRVLRVVARIRASK